MRLRWSRPASEHLIAIHDYIAGDNPDSAAEVVERLIQAAERLSAHPNLGRPGKVKHTRELIVAPYILVYRVVQDTVNIEAVLHGRRKYV
ncbi:MAG: type II toxin-antitoxin system RelE/ParE family toxin [Acidobacteriaceae bacterium]|nr:type II toxin-antitoxin system RelE/ParE family toxin [Acidobacteriaceae bacterium]